MYDVQQNPTKIMRTWHTPTFTLAGTRLCRLHPACVTRLSMVCMFCTYKLYMCMTHYVLEHLVIHNVTRLYEVCSFSM